MKLTDLLEEIKVGSENYKEQKTTEELLETFDEDLDNYRISNTLSVMIRKMSENLNENNTPTIRSFRKALDKIKMFEDKLEDRGHVSKAYARMKFDSLNEDYNSILENLKSKKVYRSFDRDVLAHSIALLRHQQKVLGREAELREVNLKEADENFEIVINKEYKLISEAIG